MDIRVATTKFERWLSGQVHLVRGDLRHKHMTMGADPFSFLRATYYRWAQHAANIGGVMSKAPHVLAVGDLHLENFGTWRDALGRLAWGINDFDEAFTLPYTHDLVRLATSTLLALDMDHLSFSPKAACRAIAEGYREGMQTGGRPFVIGEEHRWFKPILRNPLRDPGLFWDKLRALPLDRAKIPADAKATMIGALPDRRIKFEVRHRLAGLGNLGKPRYTAIAEYQGGPVAREAKALTLSAAAWAQSSNAGPYYARILANAVRAADPFLTVHASWIARRLAPDCRRLEISSLSRVKDEEWLLHAMGFETANVHLGTPAVRHAILQHMADIPKGALREAALTGRDTLMKDFQMWHKIR